MQLYFNCIQCPGRFRCADITYFPQSRMCWWPHRLFALGSPYEQHCCENSLPCFSWVFSRGAKLGNFISSTSSVCTLKEPPRHPTIAYFHPWQKWALNFFTALPMLVNISTVYYTLPGECEVLIHCGFVHISLVANDSNHLSIHYWKQKMPVQDPGPMFSIWVVYYWGLRVLYIFKVQIRHNMPN